MIKKVQDLEKSIDIENVTNYLRYRLEDTKDLLKTLKPYADGFKKTIVVKQGDAMDKTHSLQIEIRKLDQMIRTLEHKYGLERPPSDKSASDQDQLEEDYSEIVELVAGSDKDEPYQTSEESPHVEDAVVEEPTMEAEVLPSLVVE